MTARAPKAKRAAAPATALYRITSEGGVDLGTYPIDCPALKSTAKNGMATAASLEVGMKTEVHHKMDTANAGRDGRIARFIVERVR